MARRTLAIMSANVSLIRDKIPEKIRRDRGAEFETRTLKQKEFERELVQKVVEEAGGLVNARSRKELVGELADILVVIGEIIKVKKIDKAELDEVVAENVERKGGFHKRIFLVWSSDTGYRTNEPKGKSPKR
jgi:predicted house-cleaning noncanonical NTP pyrophosphatase (MazG superfamily)